MKIDVDRLRWAVFFSLIISLFLSGIWSYGLFMTDKTENDIYFYFVSIFLALFLIQILPAYITIGTLTVFEAEKKGIYYYLRKFYFWRAIIRLFGIGVLLIVALFIILVSFLSEIYPFFLSIFVSTLIVFFVVFPISLLFLNLRKKKIEISKQLDEIEQKRRDDISRIYNEKK